jgi:cleavage and polyadenylation specificity factor subunit 2
MVLFYRHLNGCVLDTLNRPSVLITDAFNATYVQSRRRLRDEQLMSKLDFEINVYSSD